MAKSLNVELTLTATDADENTPFSEAIQRTYNLTPAQFHEMEKALVGVLLGFGDAANQTATDSP